MLIENFEILEAWEILRAFDLISVPVILSPGRGGKYAKRPACKWKHLSHLDQEELENELKQIWDEVRRKPLRLGEILGIGILTGVGFPVEDHRTFLVLDVDDVERAKEFLLEKLSLKLADLVRSTLTVRTPSGGLHLYFLVDQRVVEQIPSAVNVFPGADVRSRGGLVVAPPTPGYQILNWKASPADLPEEILEVISKQGYRLGDELVQARVYPSKEERIPVEELDRAAEIIAGILDRAGYSFRHYIALGLAGLCWHYGLRLEDALYLVGEVGSQLADEELVYDRLRAVRDTYKAAAGGKCVAWKKYLVSYAGLSEVVYMKIKAVLWRLVNNARRIEGSQTYVVASSGHASCRAACAGGA